MIRIEGITLEGKELGPLRFRPFYANQNSELNLPIFLRKKGPNNQKNQEFVRTPNLTAMAQVLPFLITKDFQETIFVAPFQPLGAEKRAQICFAQIF